MISLKKRQSGFTIVELLIVIVVIGILAAIVITTYSGIQSKGRNTERTTDITAIQSKLEAYYAEEGYYPRLADLNDEDFVKEELKGLDLAALRDPSGDDADTTPVSGTAGAKVYSYVATTGGSSPTSCEGDITTCAAYTLTATYEGDVNEKPNIVKNNLN